MRRFKRKGALIVTHLDAYEATLLTALIGQLIELVQPEPTAAGPAYDDASGAEQGEPDDPFAAWAQELQAPPAPAPEDPALLRLFPTAYVGDDAAAADFRRFTEPDLRNAKIADARTVLARIATTDHGAHPLQIPSDEVQAWLRTLTALRLTVGTRLGITDAASADEVANLPKGDPREYMASVYDWLGFAQETLISSL